MDEGFSRNFLPVVRGVEIIFDKFLSLPIWNGRWFLKGFLA
jgi:hypothetical protein